jgi:hypothetical protein
MQTQAIWLTRCPLPVARCPLPVAGGFDLRLYFRDDLTRPRQRAAALACGSLRPAEWPWRLFIHGQKQAGSTLLRSTLTEARCPVAERSVAEPAFWGFARRERPFSCPAPDHSNDNAILSFILILRRVRRILVKILAGSAVTIHACTDDSPPHIGPAPPAPADRYHGRRKPRAGAGLAARRGWRRGLVVLPQGGRSAFSQPTILPLCGTCRTILRLRERSGIIRNVSGKTETCSSGRDRESARRIARPCSMRPRSFSSS